MTDRRTHFANARVAHVSLAGRTRLPLNEGVRMRVISATAALHPSPDTTALDRQSLYGAAVTVLEEAGGRAFVRDETMGYVGYMPRAALGEWRAPTHRVIRRGSLLLNAPDIKAPTALFLPLGALISGTAVDDRFVKTDTGHWAISDHLAPAREPLEDPVAVAEMHLGTPYVWGGNSAFGIDCSGLVQVSCAACGIACPGDSDLQEAALGRTLPPGTVAHRGDLLFWKGHVAWVADSGRIVHANAGHMAVAYEPIGAAVARIEAQGDGPVTRHARLN